MLYVNDSGALVPTGKIRGRKKSLLELANLLIDAVKNSGMNNSVVAISHGDCPQDAGFLADVIKDATGVSDIIINHINPAIASHSGPGTVAVFYETVKR
jgi:fatty acid-binding protein DegV